MAIFTRFLGSSVSIAGGVAIGGAVQGSLNPLTRALENDTWAIHPNMPVDAVLAAIGLAQGQIDHDAAYTWALHQGYGQAQMDAMVAAADVGPGTALAYQLRRRNAITIDEFKTALKREAIEDEWVAGLVELLDVLLSPAELANAVVQGHRTFDAALPDAIKQGLSQPNFQTMVDNTGLPPGPETLLEWKRRGIIDKGELEQGIREGHTKVKYIPFYEKAETPVLSHTTYAGLRLRGWQTKDESDAGGALTGYTPEQMELEYLNRGRPATPRQLRVGYARGAVVPGVPGGIDGAITKAVEQSDIRPEYTAVEIAASYTLPSPFVLRGLAQSGALTQAQVHTILLESGWLEQYASAVAAFWTKGTAAKTGAETKTELEDEYVLGFIDEAEYRAALTALGFTGHEQDLEVLHAEVSAIKSARTAATTKLRNAYEKDDITQAAFSGALAAIGMHQVAIDREVAYANIVKGV